MSITGHPLYQKDRYVSQSLSVNNYRYIISRFLADNEDGYKSRIVFGRRQEGDIFFFYKIIFN